MVFAAILVSAMALDRSGIGGGAAPAMPDRDVEAQPGMTSARMAPQAESRDMMSYRGERRCGAGEHGATRGGNNVMGARVHGTPAPETRAATELARRDYCTVISPFMFKARCGMQWKLYVPFGTPANEMVSPSPGFVKKLLSSGAI